jgi:predicted GNAT superfamily acetyltransferase
MRATPPADGAGPAPATAVTDWDETPRPARAGGFELRRLQTTEEFEACVALQHAVWGKRFSEVVPASILRVVQYVGGVAAGAFTAGNELAGFVFGVSGIRDARLSHWSDTLAVRAEYRNRGLGEDLKRYQRDLLLPLRVERVYWTFDPLESKNAYLNIVRLGVVVAEYRRDFYGATQSVLHDGIGTDRLVAVWDIGSARVRERLAGRGDERISALASVPAVNAARATAAGPESGEADLRLDAPRVRVLVPADVQQLKERAPAAAIGWRRATRAAFEHYFALGYVARDFVRDGECGSYVLEHDGASDVAPR